MRQGTIRTGVTQTCQQMGFGRGARGALPALLWLAVCCVALSLLLAGAPTRAFADETTTPAPEAGEGQTDEAGNATTGEAELADPPVVADLQAQATDAATKAHVAPATGQRTIIDSITYRGLTPGATYEVVGSLHLVAADGTDEGALGGGEDDATARATLTPEEADGTTQLSFDLDTSGLAGRRVVAYVQVYLDDILVMELADLGDAQQSVSFVRMGSALTDARTKGHLSEAAADAQLVDTISYTGLVAGQTYTCTVAAQVEGADGEQAGEAQGASTASLSFVPEQADGSVEVPLDLDTSAYAGKTVSASERLELAGAEGTTLVATDSDFADDGQPVRVVAISTELTDKADGDHQLGDGQAQLVDTVRYQGLVPGDTYTIVGAIHLRAKDGSDAGALTGHDGKDLTASREFTPETSEGTVEIELALDASDLGEGVAVAFEVLYEGDVRIASHEDISDDSQAVARQGVAALGTTASGTTATTGSAGTGTGELLPQTGRFPLAYALVVGGCASTVMGGVALSIARRKGLELPHSYRRRRHYVA